MSKEMKPLEDIVKEITQRFIGCDDAVRGFLDPTQRTAALVQCQSMWLSQLLAARQVLALETIAAVLAADMIKQEVMEAWNEDQEEDEL